jgi:hypothetical protein
MEIYLYGRS